MMSVGWFGLPFICPSWVTRLEFWVANWVDTNGGISLGGKEFVKGEREKKRDHVGGKVRFDEFLSIKKFLETLPSFNWNDLMNCETQAFILSHGKYSSPENIKFPKVLSCHFILRFICMEYLVLLNGDEIVAL